MKNITLEMSLKPFKKTDDSYIKNVAAKMFEQWRPLIEDAKSVSVMLWTSDGSEILEYDGDMEREMEWCRYVGGANPRREWNKKEDPEGVGLHTRYYYYMDNPPSFTYGILKKIISIIKQTGRELFPEKKIYVGETFDPGPEFAKSDFKYNRHNEICIGESMGRKSMVCCYGVLNADSVKYAGFPNGIPDKTPFGTFFGRQCNIFLKDMGFDYIWFSNGFGFGTETWGITGAIFDGKKFHTDRIDAVKENILGFWRAFRKECPDIPIQTRGTNLSVGVDFASDGVPAKEIYEGDFGMLAPPNSPWAALNDDFGLEIMGHLSRISYLPKNEEYMFRYYVHDPWWVNSPWYDRYGSQPHDIYLPMALSRINKDGNVCAPDYLNLLSVDNSWGDMPKACAIEPLAHLVKAIKEAPDAPSPLLWVYPFREYNENREEAPIREGFFGDWYIKGAINEGLPLSTVVTTDNFVKTRRDRPEIYNESVIVSPVPNENSEYEKEIFKFLRSGGKVIFYGSVSRAGRAFLDLINVELTSEKSGEIALCSVKLQDKILKGDMPLKYIHRAEICAGGIDTVLSRKDSSVLPFAMTSDGEVIGTAGKNFVWLRGGLSCRHEDGERDFIQDRRGEHFPIESLMRRALSHLGYEIAFEAESACQKLPVTMIHRYDNAYMFSVYSPDTTVKTKMKFPLGAPVMIGLETAIEDGYASYHFTKAEHRECRIFVSNMDGVVSCKEVAPVSYDIRRRIFVSGLKGATVRFFSESDTKNCQVLLNSQYPHLVGDDVKVKYVSDESGTYCEAENVTGTLMFSLPRK